MTQHTNQAPSRKQATGALQARENIQPLLSAGKHITAAKSGKTYNRCQSRENAREAILNWFRLIGDITPPF